MKTAFEQSLDHAPVIALIDVDNPEQAFRAGTACWAGGFRLVAISSHLDAAPGIVSALGARADILVGLWDLKSMDRLEDFEKERIAFIFGGPSMLSQTQNADFTFIPLTNAMNTIEENWSSVCLSSIEQLGGIDAVSTQRERGPKSTLFVQGRIGGDECATYLEAGARALILTNALMSPNLLNNGDYRSIRNYAAAVHQEATHLSRNAQENTA